MNDVLSQYDTLQMRFEEEHSHLTEMQKAVRSFLGITPLHELMESTPVKALVEGILPASGVAMVYGASGSGKTYVCLGLAKAISDGRQSFLGQKVRVTGDVVYIASEAPVDVQQRYKALLGVYGSPGPHTVHVVTGLGALDTDSTVLQAASRDLINRLIADPDVRDEAIRDMEAGHITALTPKVLRTMLAAAGISPVAIFIDTFSQSFADLESENDNIGVAKIMAKSNALSMELGCPILLVHHAGKADDEDKDNGPRGASAAFANADAVLRAVKRKDSGEFYLESKKWKQGQALAQKLYYSMCEWADPNDSEDDPTPISYMRMADPGAPSQPTELDAEVLAAFDAAFDAFDPGEHTLSDFKKAPGVPRALRDSLTASQLKEWAESRSVDFVKVKTSVRYIKVGH